eukprot:PhM_4_TR1415/c0_g1_i1/m.15240
MCFNQIGAWFTFGCVSPDKVTVSYMPHMSPTLVRATLLMGPLMQLVAFTPTAVALARPSGLRRLVVAAHVIVMVTTVTMYVLLVPLQLHNTPVVSVVVVFACLGVNAIVGPTVMAAGPALVARYFPEENRTFPTGAIITLKMMSIVLWAPLGPMLAPTGDDMPRFLFVHAVLAVVPFVMMCLHHPTTPEQVGDRPATKTFALCLPQSGTAKFLVTCVVISVQCGAHGAFANTMQLTMSTRYDAAFLGWLGFGLSLSLPVGSLLVSRCLEIPQIRCHLHGLTVVMYVAVAMCFGVMLAGFGVGTFWEPLWPACPTALVVAVCVFSGMLQGVLTSLTTLRPLLEDQIPEEAIGLWGCLSYNAGYVVFLLVPNGVLVDWCILIELFIILLVLILLIVVDHHNKGTYSEGYEQIDCHD